MAANGPRAFRLAPRLASLKARGPLASKLASLKARGPRYSLFATLYSLLFLTTAAFADQIKHPTAIFAGLDKTTGRIINFEVAIDETVQFGSLQVTPRVCNTRPQTEAPQTTSFVEVDDQEDVKSEAKRIFSGWMFAASPGLHGVEHPVYDVWLTDCKGGKEVVVQAPDNGLGASAPPPAPQEAKKRGRSRKVEPVAPAPIEAAPIGPRESIAPDQGAWDREGADAPPAEKPAQRKKKRALAPPPPRNAPSSAPFFPF